MAKFWFLTLFLCVSAWGEDAAFWDPQTCVGCHREQVRAWSQSWHSRSYYDKNEIYRISVDFIAQKTRSPKGNILLKCGVCHNPHLEVKSVGDDYTYAKIFGIATTKTSLVDSSLHAKHIQNGISCYVCHRIDEIREKHDDGDAGYKIVKWLEDDTLAGPFEETMRTDYHKSVKRSHFEDSDKICTICHQGGTGENKFGVYETSAEHAASGSKQKCVECHMGKPLEAVNAPNISPDVAKVRINRSHLFIGRKDSEMLSSAIKVSFNPIRGILSLENTTPHAVPTGFGGREIDLNITYLRTNGEVITSEGASFAKTYADNDGALTLPYLATRLTSDTRFGAKTRKDFSVYPPASAAYVDVRLTYYPLAPALAVKMGLSANENFLAPSIMFEGRFETKEYFENLGK